LVRWNFRVHLVLVPIARLGLGSLVPSKVAVIGTFDVPVVVSAIGDIHHEALTQGVVAPLTGDRIRDRLQIAHEEIAD
jgi:hypothetical protein